MQVGHHIIGLESQCGYSHDRAPHAGEDPRRCFCFFGNVRVRCELTAWWMRGVHGWASTLAYAEPLWWDGVGCLFEFYNGASLSCLSVGQIGGACAHVHVCCGDLWIGTKVLLGGSLEVRCEAPRFPVQDIAYINGFYAGTIGKLRNNIFTTADGWHYAFVRCFYTRTHHTV
jgi:hypothetical protein